MKGHKGRIYGKSPADKLLERNEKWPEETSDQRRQSTVVCGS